MAMLKTETRWRCYYIDVPVVVVVRNFYRVRMFDESNNLIATQILYPGEKVQPLDRPGNLFYFETGDLFDYDTVINDLI